MLCSPRVAAILRRRVATLASALGTQHYGLSRGRLTARELDIMALVEDGLTNREIAEHLSIEVSTVKNHLRNIFDKLHVRHRAEAVARLHFPPGDQSRY
jgi:DNA-binding NarL/FixJ family response regulator